MAADTRNPFPALFALTTTSILPLSACGPTIRTPTEAIVISVVQDQPAPGCPQFGWRSYVETKDAQIFRLCGVKEAVGATVHGFIVPGLPQSPFSPPPSHARTRPAGSPQRP
jgi:hypothetical protein